MTQTLTHQAHTLFDLRNCRTRTQPRRKTSAMLRDIAFVLKMTERVQESITNPERKRGDGSSVALR